MRKTTIGKLSRRPGTRSNQLAISAACRSGLGSDRLHGLDSCQIRRNIFQKPDKAIAAWGPYVRRAAAGSLRTTKRYFLHKGQGAFPKEESPLALSVSQLRTAPRERLGKDGLSGWILVPGTGSVPAADPRRGWYARSVCLSGRGLAENGHASKEGRCCVSFPSSRSRAQSASSIAEIRCVHNTTIRFFRALRIA